MMTSRLEQIYNDFPAQPIGPGGMRLMTPAEIKDYILSSEKAVIRVSTHTATRVYRISRDLNMDGRWFVRDRTGHGAEYLGLLDEDGFGLTFSWTPGSKITEDDPRVQAFAAFTVEVLCAGKIPVGIAVHKVEGMR